ncbi:Variant SH3 domain [Geosmithia morbida]|uniref:Variant SH3 domain n=1 Tax=Geosmithia morbida TaxID=1094350 RepID=A0A9P4YVW6_9HYPO|nr:Variant SH3 domain [Geosmithia morbida]KAF4122681.1 Variant SH3 domain [Geosmithia morbida]
MPAATAETPAVAMSFANNFWGKDDAGVGPLLERMQGAKQTCDELKAFYNARASIEDEYARKLLSLTRKALGSQESGSLKASLDTVRGEVEQMGKQHQNIAAQMKSELEEPLAAFSGGMKERRKIVQNTVEKLLKTKIQQTQHVNKTRDRFEQDCLKIKGYLAQGHMVMGQEERRNKAKLEKTQISVAASNSEYEAAVRVLEETTGRWNREWKAAADKFQDLEEERLDFTKSSLWTFANISSTVCVSDDASCEKVRLSLEKMDVETDIMSFIKENGTGQEIPDAPKYINFCRGDVADNQSDISEDDKFSVAQFPRSINPAFRSSSPQPSMLDSHHDPNSKLANSLAHRDTKLNEPELPLTSQPPAPQPQQPLRTQQAIQPHQPPQPRPAQYPQAHVAHAPSPQAPPPKAQYQTQVAHTRQQSLSREQFSQTQVAHTRQQSLSREQFSQTQVAHTPPPGADCPHTGTIPPGACDPYSGTAPPGAGCPYKRTAPSSAGCPYTGTASPDAGCPYTGTASPGAGCPHTGTVPPGADCSYTGPSSGTGYPGTMSYDSSHRSPVSAVPHDPYPKDGMTMLCRTGPPSDLSSPVASNRPSSRDENSEYSNPTSFSSQEPPSGKTSPTKQDQPPMPSPEKRVFKKKSGFFQNHSPFRRKSVKEAQSPERRGGANTWHASNASQSGSPARRQQVYEPEDQGNRFAQARSHSPEPIDANASVALGVGQNVLPVQPQRQQPAKAAAEDPDDGDPIAQALAELKGVTLNKESSVRMSADHYHGISTPAPGSEAAANARSVPAPGRRGSATVSQGTPPPYYGQSGQQQAAQQQQQTPVSRLGVPPPAVTSKAMKEATKKATEQARGVFGESGRRDSVAYGASSPASRPGTRGTDMPRTASPAPTRAASPQPPRTATGRRADYGSASPNPYQSPRQTTNSPYGRQSQQSNRNSSDYYRQATPNDTSGGGGSPAAARGASPAAARGASPASFREYPQQRPQSSYSNAGDMAVQLAPAGDDPYGSMRSRGSSGRPESRAMGLYNGDGRQRSKSVADPSRMYTPRALYMYQAAIPEELGFAKGDYLAVLRHQDDGWWEAEIHNGNGRIGLVPSNYLQPC